MKEEAPSRSSSGLANRDPEGPPARPDTPNWDDRTSYEALLETALDAIVCMDEQGRLVEFNPAAEKLFGYTRKEAIGRVMADLIVPPSLREAHRNGLARYLATGEERVLNRLLELPAMRADGTEFPVELAITCQRRGERLLFTSYLRDISDRKRFEQELIGRQESLRLALDAADMGTWEWEISTNRVTWSENMERLHGMEPGTFPGTFEAYQAKVHPEDRQKVLAAIQAAVGQGEEFDLEYRMLGAGGAELWTHGKGTVIRDEAGHAVRMTGVCTNITKRKQAERRLQQIYCLTASLTAASSAQEVYELAMDALQASLGADRTSVLLFDPDGVMRFKAWRGLSDEYRQAVEGHSPWKPGEKNPQPFGMDRIDPEALGPLAATIRKEGIGALAFIPLLAGDRLIGKFMVYYNQEHRFDPEELSLSWVIAGHVATSIERQSSLDSAARLASIVEHSSDAIFSTNLAGEITSWNSAAERLLGYEADAALQGNEFMLVPESHADRLQQVRDRVGSGESVAGLDLVCRHSSGRLLDVSLSASPLRDERGRIVGASTILRDLGDRIHRENAAKFLAEAGSAFAELTDYASSLQRLADLAVPTFADWCIVDLLNTEDTLDRVVVQHSDAEKVQLARDLQSRYPPKLDLEYGLGKVIQSGEPDWMSEISRDLLEAAAEDPEHLQILLGLGLHSYICVPIRSRNKTIGAMTFVTAESGRQYTESDVRLAMTIGERAGVAIENAKLYDEIRASEEAARRQAEEMATILDVLPVGLYISHDRESKRITGNLESSRILEVPPPNNLSLSAPEPERPTHFRVFHQGRELAPEDLPVQVSAREGKEFRGVELDVAFEDGRVKHTILNVLPLFDEKREPRGAVAAVLDITERKRAERRTAAQNAVTRVLAESESPDEALPGILSAICSDLEWSVGSVWLVEPDERVLRCRHFHAQPGVRAPAFRKETLARTFAEGQGLPGRVWASRTPLWIPEILRDTNFPRAKVADKEGLHSAFSFPILAGREVVGTVEFFSPTIQEPDAELLAVMAGAGTQIGQFVRRKKAELERSRAMEEMRLVTDGMSAVVTRCSKDLEYRWVSRSYTDWIGKPTEEIVGQPIAKVIGEEAFATLRPYIERVLSGEQVHFEAQIDLPARGPRWIQTVYSPTFDEAGRTDGWVAVILDIDERKHMEESLREADRRKDEFLATLAHELRNPLAPILNSVSVLRLMKLQDPTLIRVRDVVDRQVKHMARLVDDLLDVSRITRGKLEIRQELVGLEEVIEAALEVSMPMIEASGHALEVRLPDQEVLLNGDKTRLAQVFSNLLNNAAKFTEGSGKIGLSAEVEGREAVVRVSDSGVGIEASKLEDIFQVFAQATPALDRTHEGLGIGLALVRGIVRLHGGSVSAESAGTGKGSTFTVRLPLHFGH
jgi:PAS domain S-box-containing protein